MSVAKSLASCARCGAELSAEGADCPNCGKVDPQASNVVAGKYRLERLLGRGGMGTVHLATDLSLERTCALKMLRPSLASEEDIVTRFEKEARMLARLEHPNVVPIYAVDRDGKVPFIVMKFLEGRTLSQLRRDQGRPWTAQELTPILKQLCAGLGFMHSKGVVHRDLKPGNLFISDEGLVTILDLGIARDLDSTLTRPGLPMGTPHYMSPEQTATTKIDNRSDLYSLGVILYEALTGQLPFPGESEFDLMRAHRETPPPDAAQIARLSPLMGKLLQRAMAKAPDDRYQSAKELAEAWEVGAAAPIPDAAPAAAAGASSAPATATPAPPAAASATPASQPNVGAVVRSTPLSKPPRLLPSAAEARALIPRPPSASSASLAKISTDAEAKAPAPAPPPTSTSSPEIAKSPTDPEVPVPVEALSAPPEQTISKTVLRESTVGPAIPLPGRTASPEVPVSRPPTPMARPAAVDSKPPTPMARPAAVDSKPPTPMAPRASAPPATTSKPDSRPPLSPRASAPASKPNAPRPSVGTGSRPASVVSKPLPPPVDDDPVTPVPEGQLRFPTPGGNKLGDEDPNEATAMVPAALVPSFNSLLGVPPRVRDASATLSGDEDDSAPAEKTNIVSLESLSAATAAAAATASTLAHEPPLGPLPVGPAATVDTTGVSEPAANPWAPEPTSSTLPPGEDFARKPTTESPIAQLTTLFNRPAVLLVGSATLLILVVAALSLLFRSSTPTTPSIVEVTPPAKQTWRSDLPPDDAPKPPPPKPAPPPEVKATPDPPPPPTAAVEPPAPKVEDPKEPRPARPVKPRKAGELRVVTTFKGKSVVASVTIDGVDKGHTPLAVQLPAGKHEVKVSRASGPAVTRSAKVAGDKSVVLKIELPD